MSAAWPARRRHVSSFLFFRDRFRFSLAPRISFMMLASFSTSHKVWADHVVARLLVRSGEECSLLGDTGATLAPPLVVLMALQVSKQASAIADVEPVITVGPFQLAQAEFVRLASRVLLPEFQSGTPEPVLMKWIIARTKQVHDDQRQANLQGWSRSSSSTTSRHTRILHRALSTPQGRKARGRTREPLRGKGGARQAQPSGEPPRQNIASTVVSHPDARSSPEVTIPISFRPHLSTRDVSDRLQYSPISLATSNHGRRTTFQRKSLKPRAPNSIRGMRKTWVSPCRNLCGHLSATKLNVSELASECVCTLPANSRRQCAILAPADALVFPCLGHWHLQRAHHRPV